MTDNNTSPNNISRCGLFPSTGGWVWYNFWWGKGTYINTCEVPQISTNRWYYESWLGTGNQDSSVSYSGYSNDNELYDPIVATQDIKNLIHK